MKKGFTLVEILAVIVILGIIMVIGSIAVVNILNNSDEKNLITEGEKLAEAAKLYYDAENMSGDICISLNTLVDNGYYQKQNSSYHGSVRISSKKTSSGGISGVKTTAQWFITNKKLYLSSGNNHESYDCTDYDMDNCNGC